MKHEAAPRPVSQTNETFVEIIENEYGTDAARQVIGKAAVRETVPFGNQFMSELPMSITNPKATTPGGLTATTNNGIASLDDSSSNDVA